MRSHCFLHIGQMDVSSPFLPLSCFYFCVPLFTYAPASAQEALYRVPFTPSLFFAQSTDEELAKNTFTFTDFHWGPKSRTADPLLSLLCISNMKLELGEASLEKFIKKRIK